MGLVAGASTPTGGKSKEITVTGDTLDIDRVGDTRRMESLWKVDFWWFFSGEAIFIACRADPECQLLLRYRFQNVCGAGLSLDVSAWLQGCCLPVLFSATAIIRHQNISSYLNHFHHLSPNRKHDITYKMWFHESCLKPSPCFSPSFKSHSILPSKGLSPKYNPIL